MAKKPVKQAEASTKTHKIGRPLDLASRLAMGATYTELAAAYRKKRQTVAEWAKHPEVQAEIEAIRQEILAEAKGLLVRAAPIAIQVLIGRATGKSKDSDGVVANIETTPAASVAAARALLDLVGLGEPQKIELSGNVGSETEAELDARLARLTK